MATREAGISLVVRHYSALRGGPLAGQEWVELGLASPRGVSPTERLREKH